MRHPSEILAIYGRAASRSQIQPNVCRNRSNYDRDLLRQHLSSVGIKSNCGRAFLELESYLQPNLETASSVEIKSLYANFLFSTPYLRDDLAANSKLYRLISQKYIDQCIKPNFSQPANYSFKPTALNGKLKIGFLSNHFTAIL